MGVWGQSLLCCQCLWWVLTTDLQWGIVEGEINGMSCHRKQVKCVGLDVAWGSPSLSFVHGTMVRKWFQSTNEVNFNAVSALSRLQFQLCPDCYFNCSTLSRLQFQLCPDCYFNSVQTAISALSRLLFQLCSTLSRLQLQLCPDCNFNCVQIAISTVSRLLFQLCSTLSSLQFQLCPDCNFNSVQSDSWTDPAAHSDTVREQLNLHCEQSSLANGFTQQIN